MDRRAAAVSAAPCHGLTLRAELRASHAPVLKSVMWGAASGLLWRTAVRRTVPGKVALGCCRSTLRVEKRRLVLGAAWGWA